MLICLDLDIIDIFFQAVVKLDFINAFNTVRRDSMLETVAQDLPELFNYVSYSYASASSLRHFDAHFDFGGRSPAGWPVGSTNIQLDIAW